MLPEMSTKAKEAQAAKTTQLSFRMIKVSSGDVPMNTFGPRTSFTLAMQLSIANEVWPAHVYKCVVEFRLIHAATNKVVDNYVLGYIDQLPNVSYQDKPTPMEHIVTLARTWAEARMAVPNLCGAGMFTFAPVFAIYRPDSSWMTTATLYAAAPQPLNFWIDSYCV